MKVVHLTSGHSPTDTRVFLKECRSLASSGFDVTLVYPGKINEREKDGVRLVGTGIAPRSRWDRILNTPKQIFKTALETQGDVFHFHDPALIPFGRKLKALGKTVIYDAHEDLPRQTLTKEYLPQFARPLLAWFLERYENKASKEFDAVIAATPTIAERFSKIGVKTVVVANYPLKNEFLPEVKTRSREKKTACYIGGLTRTRGFCEMIRAFSLLGSARLLLAGPPAEQGLINDAFRNDGWNCAEHLGELDRKGIQALLARAQVGLVVLHPIVNYLDALPIKMFEYMAAGLPVVASNFPLWRKIVEDSGCGICVDPMNPKEIAAALQFIFDNPDKAAEMGQRGRNTIETLLNWENEEKKLIQVYESLRA